jgi:hypothetical protein
VLRHPPGAREMALECPPSAIGFTFRVEMQHYSCDVTPVGAFSVRVEQAQIGDNVLLVVNGQGAVSAASGSRGGIRMGHSRDDSIASFALGRWQIDDPMRAPPTVGTGHLRPLSVHNE